ncbi:hypothetical protein [Chryseolinea lacunae]|uniref:Uncharacterized protein n=1 Tax=Chryseolinea lacunae TaxID=2801331 RepID=A0ABS1KM80_9BACT|nr:hypothetical protein [Chryseolinea lacunae]MBL0740560.1 hypothetical protein [Chryseolinea lacunae]
MKTKTLLFAMLPLLVAACQTPSQPDLAPETLFDNAGLDVITSSFNTRQQTMSTLYGNTAALRAATDSSKHVAGEEYTLVTWEQKPNPLWFGSNINGAVKTIEHVTTSLDSGGVVVMHYELVQGKPEDRVPATPDDAQRIVYILQQRASFFP